MDLTPLTEIQDLLVDTPWQAELKSFGETHLFGCT